MGVMNERAGDTAWVLLSAVLVLGMMPGLAFFEAGLLRRKSALSLLTQVRTCSPSQAMPRSITRGTRP